MHVTPLGRERNHRGCDADRGESRNAQTTWEPSSLGLEKLSATALLLAAGWEEGRRRHRPALGTEKTASLRLCEKWRRLVKNTHGFDARFAPTLVITATEIDGPSARFETSGEMAHSTSSLSTGICAPVKRAASRRWRSHATTSDTAAAPINLGCSRLDEDVDVVRDAWRKTASSIRFDHRRSPAACWIELTRCRTR